MITDLYHQQMPISKPKKLLLFDIDGTLVMTDGVAGRVMVQAIFEEVGVPVSDNRDVYLGSTDPMIVHNLLEQNGVRVGDIDAVTNRILSMYAERVLPTLSHSDRVKILPGCEALLQQAKQAGLGLGLVTGNIKAGAEAKLQPHGLDMYFPIGAFGNDKTDRNLLPPIAIRRAESHYRTEFAPKDVWIIGDTPKDIGCAKANGLKSLAVATGWIDRKELEAHQPDVVLDDLQNTSQVMKIFNSTE